MLLPVLLVLLSGAGAATAALGVFDGTVYAGPVMGGTVTAGVA